MENVILSPISLASLEQLIQKTVSAAFANSQHASVSAEEPQTFTISELANYLKVTKPTIHAYKKRGILPYFQTGRTVYFKKSEVDAALEVGKKKGANK